MLPRKINASEVHEYIFCPRAWALRQRGVALPPEAQAEREERLERGNLSHQQHGEAVCQAHSQLRQGTNLLWIGLAVVVVGVLWRLFS